VTEKPYDACKERVPTASIASKQDKCNRRAVPFRKLFDFSAPHGQGCLNMQGWRAKLQPSKTQPLLLRYDILMTYNEHEKGEKSR
jgi:hypothetical protein